MEGADNEGTGGVLFLHLDSGVCGYVQFVKTY